MWDFLARVQKGSSKKPTSDQPAIAATESVNVALRRNPVGEALRSCDVSLPEAPLIARAERQDANVTRAYVIATTGRAGSTWLTSMLANIPGAGKPEEFFNETGIKFYGNFSAHQEFSSHLRWLFENFQDAGVFGLKIDPMRLLFLEDFLDLQQTFSGIPCAWIDLRRINIVKQAFSFARARKSGLWHEFVAETTPTQGQKNSQPVPVSHEEVWTDIKRILRSERDMEDFYLSRDLKPSRFFYEEILDSRDHFLRRVVCLIDPGRSWPDTTQSKDQTTKLSRPGDAEEMEFMNAYSSEINFVMNNRLTLDLSCLP